MKLTADDGAPYLPSWIHHTLLEFIKQVIQPSIIVPVMDPHNGLRSPDSVDHEPPHEDTKIRFPRIESRGKMDFPRINKVDI
jgi:hypothetical protein